MMEEVKTNDQKKKEKGWIVVVEKWCHVLVGAWIMVEMMGWKKKEEKCPHKTLHPEKREQHESGGHIVYMP